MTWRSTVALVFQFLWKISDRWTSRWHHRNAVQWFIAHGLRFFHWRRRTQWYSRAIDLFIMHKWFRAGYWTGKRACWRQRVKVRVLLAVISLFRARLRAWRIRPRKRSYSTPAPAPRTVIPRFMLPMVMRPWWCSWTPVARVLGIVVVGTWEITAAFSVIMVVTLPSRVATRSACSVPLVAEISGGSSVEIALPVMFLPTPLGFQRAPSFFSWLHLKCLLRQWSWAKWLECKTLGVRISFLSLLLFFF